MIMPPTANGPLTSRSRDHTHSQWAPSQGSRMHRFPRQKKLNETKQTETFSPLLQNQHHPKRTTSKRNRSQT
uniref:Uncharacterized protein n=1 Tax=Anguilla anguilla TaxID=7936 RepID=A0A0E9RBP3_ANGAN